MRPPAERVLEGITDELRLIPVGEFVPIGERSIYRDPDGHFLGLLSEDGDLDFINLPVKIRPSFMPEMTTGAPMLSLEIGFDPADLIIMAAGEDPYVTGKARLLAKTASQRARMAQAHHRRRIELEVKGLPQELAKLWRDPKSSVEARRQLLFQRWDECAEYLDEVDPERAPDSESALDMERRLAGQEVRDRIIRFIRNVAPAGSADAYTPAELEAFNGERASVQRFDPYGPRAG